MEVLETVSKQVLALPISPTPLTAVVLDGSRIVARSTKPPASTAPLDALGKQLDRGTLKAAVDIDDDCDGQLGAAARSGLHVLVAMSTQPDSAYQSDQTDELDVARAAI